MLVRHPKSRPDLVTVSNEVQYGARYSLSRRGPLEAPIGSICHPLTTTTILCHPSSTEHSPLRLSHIDCTSTIAMGGYL